jgi:hypothetical protein
MSISRAEYGVIQTRTQGGRVGKFIAIDPGNKESAIALFDGSKFLQSAKYPNEKVLENVRRFAATATTNAVAEHLAIEMVACYGMSVGAEIFETCVWVGRFIQAWGGQHTRVYRKDVKLHLCHSVRAKDTNVRQAIIDRYGGKERAIGRKATPGPLYGVTADQWAAIAVGLYFADTGGTQ